MEFNQKLILIESEMNTTNSFISILEKEMKPALGCTEPIAISFTAAIARKYALGEINEIKCIVSVNIAKNASSVIIPLTEKRSGIRLAAALGAVVGGSEKGLLLLDSLNATQLQKALDLVDQGKVSVEIYDKQVPFYIELAITTLSGQAVVVVQESHTNVVFIKKDDEILFDKTATTSYINNNDSLPYELLNIKEIFNFADCIDLDDLAIIKESININKQICEEGLVGDYGLNIGRNIKGFIDQGFLQDDLLNHVTMIITAGVDARMAGCPLPAFSNSGSGNQGITSTMAVVAAAEKLGSDEKKVIRACAISNLITIYIKNRLGRLSPVCGAVIAGVGASCGILYLLDKGIYEMECTVKNIIGSTSGIFCDGAKASCSLKVSANAMMAVQSALLAQKGVYVKSSDGIVDDTVIGTLDNYLSVITQGMANLDNSLMDIIINKKSKE